MGLARTDANQNINVKVGTYVPITEVEATRLALSLLEQLEVRFRNMLVEAAFAFGTPVRHGVEPPPRWVLRAIRIVYTGKPTLPVPFKINAVDFFMSLGAVLGMSKTWEAVLTEPLAEERQLEEKFAVVKDARTRVKALTAQAFKTMKKAGRKIDSLPLRPEWQRAFIRGLELGADAIVSVDGELNIESNIRSEICYFMWVYWPQIKLLGSVSELAAFFECMRQDDISQKNLQKVCREIEYHAKGPGRPKNLFCTKTK